MTLERAASEAVVPPQTVNKSVRLEAAQGPYAAQAIIGAQAVDAFLEGEADLKAPTLFQSRHWLQQTYRHLSEASGATPYLIAVRNRTNSAIVLVLPMAIAQLGREKVIGFPDFGVADYGSLITGPDWSENAMDRQGLCALILSALPKVDRLSLISIPNADGAALPILSALGHSIRSRHNSYVVSIPETVEIFLHQRGKKYRKEAERCQRMLRASGPWGLRQAEGKAEIEDAFAALHQMQAHRWDGRTGSYKLDNDPVSRFYLSTLVTESSDIKPQIFTLNVAATSIAVLYGVLSGDKFTMLRIASDSDTWGRASPGRMIVLEVMRHFVAQGVRTFDLGIGDYAFKRGLGAEARTLMDVERAFTLRGHISVMSMQGKAWLRRHPRLLSVAKYLKNRLN